jgi:hypothetical protein
MRNAVISLSNRDNLMNYCKVFEKVTPARVEFPLILQHIGETGFALKIPLANPVIGHPQLVSSHAAII